MGAWKSGSHASGAEMWASFGFRIRLFRIFSFSAEITLQISYMQNHWSGTVHGAANSHATASAESHGHVRPHDLGSAPVRHGRAPAAARRRNRDRARNAKGTAAGTSRTGRRAGQRVVPVHVQPAQRSGRPSHRRRARARPAGRVGGRDDLDPVLPTGLERRAGRRKHLQRNERRRRAAGAGPHRSVRAAVDRDPARTALRPERRRLERLADACAKRVFDRRHCAADDNLHLGPRRARRRQGLAHGDADEQRGAVLVRDERYAERRRGGAQRSRLPVLRCEPAVQASYGGPHRHLRRLPGGCARPPRHEVLRREWRLVAVGDRDAADRRVESGRRRARTHVAARALRADSGFGCGDVRTGHVHRNVNFGNIRDRSAADIADGNVASGGTRRRRIDGHVSRGTTQRTRAPPPRAVRRGRRERPERRGRPGRREPAYNRRCSSLCRSPGSGIRCRGSVLVGRVSGGAALRGLSRTRSAGAANGRHADFRRRRAAALSGADGAERVHATGAAPRVRWKPARRRAGSDRHAWTVRLRHQLRDALRLAALRRDDAAMRKRRQGRAARIRRARQARVPAEPRLRGRRRRHGEYRHAGTRHPHEDPLGGALLPHQRAARLERVRERRRRHPPARRHDVRAAPRHPAVP